MRDRLGDAANACLHHEDHEVHEERTAYPAFFNSSMIAGSTSWRSPTTP